MHPTTQRHLSHANGYRELGMLDDAHEEIEKIDRDDRLLELPGFIPLQKRQVSRFP